MKYQSKTNRAKLQFEPLEARFALAGNVTVATSGAADLKITGDDAANDVSITKVGTDWVIAGNNGTTITFDGVVGTATLPEPAGSHFKKVTIDLKGANSTGVDTLAMTGLETLGDLKISGKNGGVLKLDQLKVAGKTSIAFKDGSVGTVGTTIDIFDSVLGTGKDTSITAGGSNDRVVITDTVFGKSLTIGLKNGDNTVALFGTRNDAGGNASSSTTIAKNLAITTGTGIDKVALVGIVVGGNLKATTGDGSDIAAAAGVVIKGTTTFDSKKGDDVALIGSQDINGQPFPPGTSDNQMLGKVTVKMGDGNDLVAAGGTKFGSTVTATLGNGDDTLAELSNTYTIGALKALKGSKGGGHVNGDNLLSAAGLILDPAVLKKGQFEKADVNAIPALITQIFTNFDASFRQLLLDYGIDLGDPTGGAANDTDDQIGEAIDLTLGAKAGTLSGSADVDMYKRTVTAGQKLSFTLASPTFDGVLRLFDAAGTQLAIADLGDPGVAETLEHTFASAGTFYISVSSFPNDNFNATTGSGDLIGGSIGAYTLTTSVV